MFSRSIEDAGHDAKLTIAEGAAFRSGLDRDDLIGTARRQLRVAEAEKRLYNRSLLARFLLLLRRAKHS